jgi:hypothetical protein
VEDADVYAQVEDADVEATCQAYRRVLADPRSEEETNAWVFSAIIEMLAVPRLTELVWAVVRSAAFTECSLNVP